MFHRADFLLFRFVLIFLPAGAQVYLFLCARKAILSSRLPAAARRPAVAAAGLAIALLFLMNGYYLLGHVRWIDPPAAARAFLFYLPAVWALGSVFSALFLGLAHLARALATGTGSSSDAGGPGAEALSAQPADAGRRRFLRTGMAGLAVAPFVLSGYGAACGGRAYEVREVAVPFGRRMRVVQLTDIHAGVYMTRREIRRYARLAASLRPDLFVLTGDFISNSPAFLPECLEEMAAVPARYGTFAVLGNHERWYGGQRELKAAFRKYAIPLLINAHTIVETDDGPFAVAGIDDLRNGHPRLDLALHGLPPSIPTLLLSHRPEIFPLAAASGIPLTLAGHWHGGQIKLVLPGMVISPAHLRSPYPEGMYRIGESRLYVSRGVGTTFTPVRLNAPPEVTVLNLS
jgi:hypothetical protein